MKTAEGDRDADNERRISSPQTPEGKPIGKNSDVAKSDKIPLTAWQTLAILSSIATMIMYTETMLVPALPNIISEFHLSYGISPWILTTYLIVGAIMTPVASSLAEMHGKKKVLLAIMVVYALGVVIGGLGSTNLYSFVAARALQGVGMAMFPIAFSVIREQFPKSKLAIGQGIITSMFASGAIVGLIVGAAISSQFGWRMTFLSIVPITFLLPILVWRVAKIGIIHPDWTFQARGKSAETAAPTASPPQMKKKQMLDLPGAALLGAAITLFLVSLTFIETSGSGGGGVSLAIFGAVCAASTGAFVAVERRASNPLIDLKLLKNRVLLYSNIMIVVIGFSMFMVFQTVPILAESPPPAGFGANQIGAAQIQLPFAIILLIFGPTSGFIVARLGSIRPTIMGASVSAFGFFMLTAFHSQPWMVSAALAVVSTGLSLGMTGVMNVILLVTPFRNMVTSIGMTSLLRIVGSAVGPAIAGVLMQLQPVTVPGHSGVFPSPESYTLIYLIAGAMCAFSILLAFRIRSYTARLPPADFKTEKPTQ